MGIELTWWMDGTPCGERPGFGRVQVGGRVGNQPGVNWGRAALKSPSDLAQVRLGEVLLLHTPTCREVLGPLLTLTHP